jgi:hypothetical protein
MAKCVAKNAAAHRKAQAKWVAANKSKHASLVKKHYQANKAKINQAKKKARRSQPKGSGGRTGRPKGRPRVC